MVELYPLTIATGIVIAAALAFYFLRRPLARLFGKANRRVEQAEHEVKDAYRKGMEEEEKL